MKQPHHLPAMDMQEAVIEYLQQHPTFFNDKPELVNQLILQHHEGAGSISLIERQVHLLREKGTHYRQQLDSIIAAAQDNEKINQRIHKIALQLLDCRDFNQALDTVQTQLRDHFRSEFLQLHIFSDYTDCSALDAVSPHGKPRCGCLTASHRQTLFPTQYQKIQSVAVIPLQQQKRHGLLAIGSTDKQQFQPGMGTDYLTRLGELIGKTLDVLSDNRVLKK